MSIVTMMSVNIEHQQHPDEAIAAAAAGGDTAKEKGAAPSKKTLDSAMEKITAFIPSEVIGSYVALLGIISPQTERGKWVIFFICLLLIPVYMLFGYLSKQKKRNGEQSAPASKRDTAILFVLASVAFVSWAAALPGTPFLSISTHATVIGGACVIIITSLMYKVAELFDLVPNS
jgi:hypothetical protein